MKPSLQLKLSQHLALTPQLQQSIKLLQLSAVELQEFIDAEIEKNPLLARDENDSETAPAEEVKPAEKAESQTEVEMGGDDYSVNESLDDESYANEFGGAERVSASTSKTS